MNPTIKLRGGASGPTLAPSTPGYVLTVQADGESVKPEPGGGSIPLPIPVEDLDATAVPDGYVLVALGGVAQWAPVPTAFAISSFAHSPTLVQVGATVTNPAFTAAYNQAATSASLTDSEAHDDALTLPATAFVSPHVFTKNVFGQSVAFTLHAASALGSSSAGVSISWGENVYYGAAADPGGGGYTEAFIESLTGALRLAPNGSYAINAGAGASSFFCALTVLGLTTADFTVGGFPFSCTRVATGVSVTNANGIVETYDVFRSDNLALGAFNLDVS